jgi:hypothetical protein
MGLTFFQTCESLSSFKGNCFHSHSLFDRKHSEIQSEMYMKWILIVQAHLNKYTLEIKIQYSWMKTCWNPVVSHTETWNLQFLESSKLWPVSTCHVMHLCCDLWGKLTKLFKSLTTPVVPSVERKPSKISRKPYLYMPYVLVSCNQLTKYLIPWKVFRAPPSNFSENQAGINL